MPATIERELAAFEQNPEVEAVCGTLECWYSWSDQAGATERDFVVDLVTELDKVYHPPALLVHNLNAGGRKPGITCVMLKSDFARAFGVFEEDYRYAWEDQVFWAKVSLNAKIYVMDAVLAKYRQHPDSTCKVEIQSGKDIPSVNVFLDWLAAYLERQNIDNPEVWRAFKGFQRTLRLETRLRKLKTLYRRLVPLHWRYKIRDKWIVFGNYLSRPSNRKKQ